MRSPRQIKALVNEILGTLKDILVLNPFMRELLVQNQSHALRSIDNPVYLADYALTMLSSPDPISLQDVLQELDVSVRC